MISIRKLFLRRSAAALSIFFVAGCALLVEDDSTKERRRIREEALREQKLFKERQDREAKFAAFKWKCQSYGFAIGTEGYSRCLMQLDQQAQALSKEEAIRSERELKCLLARIAATSDPDITYERCMSGLPPTSPKRFTCHKSDNALHCTEQ